MGESFAMPRDATSLQELERVVTLLIARENRWRVYADLARRAAIDLPAPELWMLARLGEREPMTLRSLGAEPKIPRRPWCRHSTRCARGLAQKDAGGELRLTPAASPCATASSPREGRARRRSRAGSPSSIPTCSP